MKKDEFEFDGWAYLFDLTLLGIGFLAFFVMVLPAVAWVAQRIP